jgi:hypothetical protein
MLTGHIVNFTTRTHINHLYMTPDLTGGILQSRKCEHTFVLSFWFSLSIFRRLLYCFMLLFFLFLFIQFFAALSDHLVCQVVKPAVLTLHNHSHILFNAT